MVINECESLFISQNVLKNLYTIKTTAGFLKTIELSTVQKLRACRYFIGLDRNKSCRFLFYKQLFGKYDTCTSIKFKMSI